MAARPHRHPVELPPDRRAGVAVQKREQHLEVLPHKRNRNLSFRINRKKSLRAQHIAPAADERPRFQDVPEQPLLLEIPSFFIGRRPLPRLRVKIVRQGAHALNVRMLIQKRRPRPDGILLQDVVGVRPDQIFPRDKSKAGPQSVRGVPVYAAQDHEADASLFHPLPVGFGERHRPVAGAVVRQDYLQPAVGLRQDGIQEGGQIPLSVIDRRHC